MPRRLEWVDAARGFGIVLVVYGHVLRANINLAAHPVWALQDRTIYAFHMPLFFVLSGLFLGPSIERGRAAFVRSRGMQLVYPYLLWSLITAAIELALAPWVNSPISLHDALLVPFVPIEQYWFLYVLFFAQLVASALWPRRWLLGIVALAAFVGQAGLGVGALNRGPLALLLTYLPFLVLGMVLRPLVFAGVGRSVQGDAAVALTGMGLLALMLIGMLTVAGPIAGFLAGVGGSAGVVGLAALVARVPGLGPMLVRLGRVSMAIYVSHTLAAAGTRIGLKLIGIPPSSAFSLGACVMAGLLGPLLLVQVVEPFGWRRWTGLGLTAPRRKEAGEPEPADAERRARAT